MSTVLSALIHFAAPWLQIVFHRPALEAKCLAMDISKWLEETIETAERPTLPDQLGFPAFLRPKDKPVVERSAQRHGKRKRRSADSSILGPEKSGIEPSRSKPGEVDSDDSIGPAHQNLHSNPALAAEDASEEHSDRYQRKPRRKTHLDRYNTKTPKDLTKDRGDDRKDRAQKSRNRKTERKKRKDKSGLADVVHNFHAKNVPKERLTLQPRGIFKKGKASFPFRGRGLPDLVFSEMNFLQKRSEPVHEALGLETGSTKRRNESTRDNVVSTYFPPRLPKRSPLLDRHTNVQTSSHRVSLIPSDKRGDENQKRHTSTTAASVRPTTELPAGARGLSDVGNHMVRSRTTTYFTWSDSARLPSPEAPKLTFDIGELDTEKFGRQIKVRHNTANVQTAERPEKQSKSMPTNLRPAKQGRPIPSEQVAHHQHEHDEATRDDSRRNHHITNVEQLGLRQSQPGLEIRPSRGESHQSGRREESSVDPPTETATIEPIIRGPLRAHSEAALNRPEDSEPLTSSSLAKLLKDCKQVATIVESVDQFSGADREPSEHVSEAYPSAPSIHPRERSRNVRFFQKELSSVYPSSDGYYPGSQGGQTDSGLDGYENEDEHLFDEEQLFGGQAPDETLEDEVERFDVNVRRSFRGDAQGGVITRRPQRMERRSPNATVDGEFPGFWRPNVLY
ncbi:hypothetical protein EJ08DRAFT_681229 [Tothia fuscella]|uniref:Uncharacterized protein n=1 Tax=Tothia fuscella TaxID=1048955 RepID=A0A9P4NLL7_9PEZI|nr:hypothetical protein EJ08DRAFT_681229 [Tothia fuscella]